jgi:hypothetical protein
MNRHCKKCDKHYHETKEFFLFEKNKNGKIYLRCKNCSNLRRRKNYIKPEKPKRYSNDNERITTKEHLKRYVSYSPDSGLFYWTNAISNHVKNGDIAGSITKSGYVIINIRYKRYYAHILAHIYMTGTLPKKFIDHKNRIRSDNRWSNLREADRHQNQANLVSGVKKTSKFKGVYWCKKGNCFYASMRFKGEKVLNKAFLDEIEAAKAYDEFAEKIHGEYANTNKKMGLY